jgi:hypothetical protein
MESNKTQKRIKIIGIISILFGSLLLLSNGLPYLILKLTNYPYELTPNGKFYLSPVYLASTGVLLIISGLFVKSRKKIGITLTSISTILLITLISLHATNQMNGFDGDLKIIGTIGSTVFILLFLIPAFLLFKFLFSKETSEHFDK